MFYNTTSKTLVPCGLGKSNYNIGVAFLFTLITMFCFLSIIFLFSTYNYKIS